MENEVVGRVAVGSIAWLDVSEMKSFRSIIASTAKDLSTEMSLCLADPFVTGVLQPTVTFAAPSVRSRIFGVRRGEEADLSSITQSSYNVLADEGLLLRSMFCTMRGSGCFGHAGNDI